MNHIFIFSIRLKFNYFQLALDYEDDLSTELARYLGITSGKDEATQKEQVGRKFVPRI